jgi:hypothetical protein
VEESLGIGGLSINNTIFTEYRRVELEEVLGQCKVRDVMDEVGGQCMDKTTTVLNKDLW